MAAETRLQGSRRTTADRSSLSSASWRHGRSLLLMSVARGLQTNGAVARASDTNRQSKRLTGHRMSLVAKKQSMFGRLGMKIWAGCAHLSASEMPDVSFAF